LKQFTDSAETTWWFQTRHLGTEDIQMPTSKPEQIIQTVHILHSSTWSLWR